MAPWQGSISSIPTTWDAAAISPNASYAVADGLRGKGIGRALVIDSLREAAALGFRILQFNAVVASNAAARKLYEALGFHSLGTIAGGFRRADGSYVDICPYWRETI